MADLFHDRLHILNLIRMKKNVVVITAVGYPQKISYARYCFYVWNWWCRKNNVRLFILNRNYSNPDDMRPTWMRYHVFDILERHGFPYDQIALVDADTMIRWDCPNFFEISERKFCVVRDEKRRLWVRKSIRAYQPFYPGIKLDPQDYFNAGFMIFNENHRGLFQAMRQFYHSNKNRIREITRTLRKGTDQSPLNFMVMKENTEIKYLTEQYNYMHFLNFWYNNPWLMKKYNISAFVQKGFIWHFIGIDKRLNETIMGKTWERIKHNYA